jgi:hypothetical protein
MDIQIFGYFVPAGGMAVFLPEPVYEKVYAELLRGKTGHYTRA